MATIMHLTDFGGLYEAAEKLYQTGHLGADISEPLAAIAGDMLKAEVTLFSSQGRRGGGSWARLKPDTVKRKGNNQILVRTGALRASLTELDAPGQILHFDTNSLIFGTELEYAGIHQEGAPSRNIPRRPVIKFNQTDLNRWTAIITRHIMRVFTNAE